MNEFISRTSRAYQESISFNLSANDASALQAFAESHPEIDPVYGEKAVIEAAKQGKRVGIAYVLAICERLSNEQSRPKADDLHRTDNFIRWYKSRQRERGQFTHDPLAGNTGETA